MPRKPVVDQQAGWLSGLNSVSDPAALTPDQARQLGNARLTTYGSATRRGGTRKCLSATVGVSSTANVGIYWPLKLQAILTAASPSQLYAGGNPSAFTTTWAMTMTSRGTVSANTLVVFVDGTGAEVVYGESQAGGLVKYDGTTATTVTAGTPVAVDGACVYDARLWGWNSAASPNSVYYSAVLNGDTLGIAAQQGGQIVVTTYANEAIVRCAAVGASLLIFHKAGISRLTGFGQSDLSVTPQPATNDIAICGRNALVVYHNAAWVATANGLYQVTEGSATPIGSPDRPDPTIAAIRACSTPTNVVVYANQNTFEVWVIIPSTGTYAYNLLTSSWSGPFTGAVFAAAVPSIPFEVLDTSGVFRRTVFPPDATGMAWEMDSPDYFKDAVNADGSGGTAYAMTLQCRRMFGEDRAYSKSWRWVRPTAILSSGATAPTAAISSVLGGTSTQTFATPSGVQDIYYLNGMGVGPYVDVVITDPGAAASEYLTVSVEGYLLGQR